MFYQPPRRGSTAGRGHVEIGLHLYISYISLRTVSITAAAFYAIIGIPFSPAAATGSSFSGPSGAGPW